MLLCLHLQSLPIPTARSNYGVTTTARVEFAFVVDDKATPEQERLSRWPAEAEDKLSDRSKCRKKPSMAKLIEIANEDGGRNEQLKKANHPPLVEEELIAANLYTGPARRPLAPGPGTTPWVHFHNRSLRHSAFFPFG